MYARKELSQTAKDLLAMADYIEKHGWCQGQPKDANDRVCLIGAGYELGFSYHPFKPCDTSPAFLAIERYVGRLTARWNDVAERTQEQVLIMLRELAYNLDSKESD